MPKPAVGPDPLCKMDDHDRAKGMWGHQQGFELQYGPVDSSTKVKTNSVTAKIGQQWNTQFEQNGSLPHGQTPRLAVPDFRPCASSGQGWPAWYSQRERARPTARPAIASGARPSHLQCCPILMPLASRLEDDDRSVRWQPPKPLVEGAGRAGGWQEPIFVAAAGPPIPVLV